VTDPYEDGARPELATDPALSPAVEPLTLYRVDGRGRVNLTGVVADGVEFYTATRNGDGTVTLAPVRVATTSVKRTADEVQ
jgi:hypothetical protein